MRAVGAALVLLAGATAEAQAPEDDLPPVSRQTSLNRSPVPSSPLAPTFPTRPETWPGAVVPAPPPGVRLGTGQGKPVASAQIIAKVGSEVILASDALYLVMEYMATNEQVAKLPPEDFEQAKAIATRQILRMVIDMKLWLIAARREIPPEKMTEVEGILNKSFESEQLPLKLKKLNAASRGDLDERLRQFGSSLEAMRRGHFERNIAMMWRSRQAKDDAEITHEEMLQYYRDHAKDFEITARARWEHLMVKFDKYESKTAAYKALAEWGNQIQRGATISTLAAAHSDDPSSVDGGKHDWTTKDSLVSSVLDKAVFGLPVGQLSQILEDEQGFHIVRVVDRQESGKKAFTDVQKEIKNHIRDLRGDQKAQAYIDELRKQIPVWTIYDNQPQAAARTSDRSLR